LRATTKASFLGFTDNRAASAGQKAIIYKTPARNTIGNLDWAFREVWLEAAKAKVVERRAHPTIRRADHGEDGERRAFIDRQGVQALHRVMTDEWIDAPDGFSHEIKRMLRYYLGLISTTGIRPGLETKRIKLGNVLFVTQHKRPVIIIRVIKFQGKHAAERSVVVYERDVFPIRELLTDQIAWRRAQGATDTDDLFGRSDGSFPEFNRIMEATLIAAGALTDPMTGKRRCSYSLRHFLATRLIELGLSVPHIAAWLGTSSKMIEAHYNRFLTERNAHLLNGVPDLRVFAATGRMTRRVGTRRGI
jgi:integrase